MNQGDYDLIDDILYPKSIWRYSDISFGTYSKECFFKKMSLCEKLVGVVMTIRENIHKKKSLKTFQEFHHAFSIPTAPM